MVFTSSKPSVDAPVPLDVILTTMPCKYSTARFVRFKYCPLERSKLRVTTLFVPGHVLLIAPSMLSWTLEHSTSFFARRSLRASLTPNNQWPNDSPEKAPNLSLLVSIRRSASCKSSTTCDMVCLLSLSIVLSICCCSDASELDCFASPSSTPCFLLPRSGPAIATFLCSLAFEASSSEVTSLSIMSAEAISSLHHNTSASDAYPRYTHGPVPSSRCPSCMLTHLGHPDSLIQ